MKSLGTCIPATIYRDGLSHELREAIAVGRQKSTNDLKTVSQDSSLIDVAHQRLLECLGLCESPIEQIVLSALAFTVIPKTMCFPPSIHNVLSGEPWPVSPFVIVPQFPVARYRLDFLVVLKADDDRNVMIAIECDGKDFHSSAEARKRDGERDKYLMAIGIKTLRLSGSHIHKINAKLADVFSVVFGEERMSA